jgi:hypothetical protein
MTDLIALTEVHGEVEERERMVYINPAHIVSFHDDHLWRAQGTDRPSISVIRMVTGETVKVRESAACIAGEINQQAWGAAA